MVPRPPRLIATAILCLALAWPVPLRADEPPAAPPYLLVRSLQTIQDKVIGVLNVESQQPRAFAR